MPKGSFQRPRLVRKGSKEAAEDGPGAVQVKAETVLDCAGSPRYRVRLILTAGEGDDREAPPNLKW